MNDDTTAIINKLNKINSFINDAQLKLGQNKVVKLNHLDAEVNQICEQVLALPPAEAKKAQPVMANVIGNLDTLANSLQNFQTALKEKTK